MVIDDEVSVRAGVARYLRTQRHDVFEACDGAEALRLVAQMQVDLVITDINMPERDGIEVIVSLAECQPGLPVIAISGGGRVPKELLLSNAGGLGAVRTLPKPFDLTELRNAVAEALQDTARGGSLP
ncbi:MAG TPA: response regulator [Longimicrobiales bacterium]|nr:response regulator [Longimicrobiales bacterium]